ncbi:MAG: SDR family oxidoreductase [Planctomycetes bacterium]|nr:SDR family oxidoreductase [Planctomycetota bacterium]MCW8137266.1 SDR family oxidoreductase [Planctomycetota bacterium]
MAGKLAGKRALITGGGTGIGREIAHTFLEHGARVIICGRRHGPLKETVDSFKPQYPDIHFVECDISDPEDVAVLAAKTRELLGGLDILVNNAGVSERGDLESTDLKVWDRVFNVNLRGAFVVTQAMLPLLKDSGRGANVLNISSNLGRQAEQHQVAYSASKAGLDMFTRCCALDYAEAGIRFNTISPGVIDTPMQDHNKGELGYQEWRSATEQMHPLKAIGAPRDVATAALFLCSSDAEWLTGVNLPVDGGMCAR